MEFESRKAIGEFFRKSRVEAGLEAEQVSRCLLVEDADLVSQYESGEREMPAHHVFLLANLYNIAPDALVCMLYDLLRGRGSTSEKAAEG